MTTISVETHRSPTQLLEAIGRFNLAELEQFVDEVIALRARRNAFNLSRQESNLLIKINQALPDDLQNRFETHVVKRQEELLTSEEYEELLRLTEQTEKMDAERIEAMAQLAQLRGVSLDVLMNELESKPPEHV